LMPVAEFSGAKSWGYGPIDPYAIETVYGTPETFKHFVDQAHARGIGVMLDLVHNHYSRKNGLVCFDGDCLGKNGIYFFTDARGDTPWGPRPNFDSADVRSFILDNQAMWYGEYRIDGMRWDSTINIRRYGNTPIQSGFDLLRDATLAVDASE